MRASGSAFSSASVFLVLAATAIVTGCSSPAYDPTTALGKQAIIDSVNQALDVGDCAGAVAHVAGVLDHFASVADRACQFSSAPACCVMRQNNPLSSTSGVVRESCQSIKPSSNGKHIKQRR